MRLLFLFHSIILWLFSTFFEIRQRRLLFLFKLLVPVHLIKDVADRSVIWMRYLGMVDL